MAEEGQEQVIENQEVVQTGNETPAAAPQFTEAQETLSSLSQFLPKAQIEELEKAAAEEKSFNKQKKATPATEEKKV